MKSKVDNDTNPKGAGRKKAEIDWAFVDKHLKAQCDGVTIAEMLGIAPITLYRRCEEDYKVNFEAYSARKKAEGRESLRLKMYETAESGNIPMQIWLSKQYLGMKDKREETKVEKPQDNKDLSLLTDDELAMYEALLKKVTIEKPESNNNEQ